MAYLGDLLVRLKADTADFRSDLGKASESARSSFKSIERSATTAIGVLGGLSLAAYAQDFARGIKGAIDSADAMNKMSERTGIASEVLSGFRVSAQLSDVSQESLGIGLKKLATNMAAAAGGGKEQIKIFDALGISATNANGSLRSTDTVFREIASKFASFEDGAGKSALAVQLFGKAGDQMIPMMNHLSETEGLARRLGAVFSTSFAQNAERFNDNMKTMSIAVEGLKISIAEQMMPRLIEMSKEFVTAAENGDRLGGTLRFIAQGLGLIDPAAVKATNELTLLNQRIVEMETRRSELGKNKFAPSGLTANMDGEIAKLRAESNARSRLMTALTQPDDARNYDARDIRARMKTAAPVVDKRVDRSAQLAEQELKKYTSALQGIEKQIMSVTQQTNAQALAYETAWGSLADLTKGHKVALITQAEYLDRVKERVTYEQALHAQQLIGIEQTGAEKMAYEVEFGALQNLSVLKKANLIVAAMENDRRAANLKAIQDTGEALQREIDARNALRDATIDYRQAITEAAAQADFEVSLIGKTRMEIEQLTAAREADLRLKRAIASLPNDETGAAGAVAAGMQKLTEIEKAANNKRIADKIAKEREWLTGAKAAMMEYQDAATNNAEITKRLFNTTFQGLEDAIVSFVKTGKLSFRDLANSIIEDLIRIQIRKQVTSVLGGALDNVSGGGGLFGSIANMIGLGGGGSSLAGTSSYAGYDLMLAGGGPIWQGQTALVGENGPEVISAGVAGNVTPNSALGGGPVFNVDMRGASVEAVQRLEALVRQVDGSIEHRSVGAVMNARQRGVNV